MRRRDFVGLVGGAAAWPLVARAQQPNAVKRIGWLWTTGEQDPQNQAQRQAFHQEFAKLGWTDGQNFRIDYRSTPGEDDSLARTLAMEIVTTAPDVILTTGTQLTAILKQQTNTIPIVFLNVADPVVSGLIASFARPGGNITGFTNVESSFAGRWLSILKDIAPGVTRVMILHNPANPNWIDYLRTIEAAAPSLRVTVSAAPVNHADEIARQIEPFVREPGAGMIVLPSGLMINNREKIAAFAAQYRLPAIYSMVPPRKAGAWCPMGPILSIFIGERLPTWTAYCAAPSRPICRYRRRSSSSWSSISRPPRQSGSKCPTTCCSSPTG